MSGTATAPELLQAAREGDNRACEQVLEENNGLIWSVVRRYYGRGVQITGVNIFVGNGDVLIDRFRFCRSLRLAAAAHQIHALRPL